MASSEGENINWFSSFWKEHLSITRKEATELTPTLWMGSIPPSSFNQEPEKSVSNSPNLFGSQRNLFEYGWVIACFQKCFWWTLKTLFLIKKSAPIIQRVHLMSRFSHVLFNSIVSACVVWFTSSDCSGRRLVLSTVYHWGRHWHAESSHACRTGRIKTTFPGPQSTFLPSLRDLGDCMRW